MKDVQTQEVQDAPESEAQRHPIADLFLNRASTAALDHFLGPPGTPAPETVSPRARLLAGRWLAARRMCAGLSDQSIAAQTGVDAESLLLLELGLGEARRVTDEAWERLCYALAPDPADADFVMCIMNLALARQPVKEEAVMERLLLDLDIVAGDQEDP